MSRDCGAHPPERGCRSGQLATIGITSGFLRSLPPSAALFEAARSGRRNVRHEFPPGGCMPPLGTVSVLARALHERLTSHLPSPLCSPLPRIPTRRCWPLSGSAHQQVPGPELGIPGNEAKCRITTGMAVLERRSAPRESGHAASGAVRSSACLSRSPSPCRPGRLIRQLPALPPLAGGLAAPVPASAVSAVLRRVRSASPCPQCFAVSAALRLCPQPTYIALRPFRNLKHCTSCGSGSPKTSLIHH
jgi:hypothetical protein